MTKAAATRAAVDRRRCTASPPDPRRDIGGCDRVDRRQGWPSWPTGTLARQLGFGGAVASPGEDGRARVPTFTHHPAVVNRIPSGWVRCGPDTWCAPAPESAQGWRAAGAVRGARRAGRSRRAPAGRAGLRGVRSPWHSDPYPRGGWSQQTIPSCRSSLRRIRGELGSTAATRISLRRMAGRRWTILRPAALDASFAPCVPAMSATFGRPPHAPEHVTQPEAADMQTSAMRSEVSGPSGAPLRRGAQSGAPLRRGATCEGPPAWCDVARAWCYVAPA